MGSRRVRFGRLQASDIFRFGKAMWVKILPQSSGLEGYDMNAANLYDVSNLAHFGDEEFVERVELMELV